MYKHILLPTDGSPLSDMAVEQGLAFARDIDAKVTLLMAVEPFHIISADADQLAKTREEYDAYAGEQAARYLKTLRAKAEAMGVAAKPSIW